MHLFGWVDGLSKEVRVAIIGLVSTVLAAVISGMFVLLNSGGGSDPLPPAQPATVAVAALVATSTIAVPPTTEPTETPTAVIVRQEEAESGLLFATRILPNGLAIEPGVEFDSDIAQLYAVFRPGALPPGLTIAADDPHPDYYYAILVPRAGSSTTALGWVWIQDGEAVNDFAMELEEGVAVWLLYQDPRPGGIFQNDLTPGEYRIIITLGGNAITSTIVTISDSSIGTPVPDE